jgi:very-short-patch-repair endonuclease
MRNTKLTKIEKKTIIDAYESGLTYVEINKKYGFASATIGKLVKGKRSLSDANKLSYKKGRHVLSDDGRRSLSDNAKKVCIKNGKFWTKPEREFRNLLLEMDIGVKFPRYVQEIKKVKDDKNNRLFYFQYPIQRYILDFVDLDNKVVFNINGDYWHGNPLLYDHNSLGEMQAVNVRQDKNKRIFLEKNGWKVLDVWESEIYWNKELVKEKIRAVSLTVEPIFYMDSAGVQFPHRPPIIEDWSETIKRLWFKTDKKKKIIKPLIKIICNNKFCQKEFEVKEKCKKMRKFCCASCHAMNMRKVLRPSKEELDLLIKEMSMIKIGKKYGVSDRAVRKWIKFYGLKL